MKKGFNPSIFRDYDIRGTYPDQLNEDSFYVLGRAIASYIKASEIAVGHDTRLSSPSLYDALIKGINDQGISVVRLGLISTEIHYYASGKYGFPANIIVSASHNPPQYNGLKIVTKGVVPLHGGFGFPEIKKLAVTQEFENPANKGSYRDMEILDEWITHALTFIEVNSLKPLKVVLDAGNGMASISWQKIMGKLPLRIIPLFFEPDGNFPNHLPDPLDENNLKKLKETILIEKADLGLAFDGDADRMFAVDGTARIVSGTLTTAILAAHLLKKYGPSTVLYNAVIGRIVPEIIKNNGGTPVRVRVGHSFIKQHMKEYKALFAGEHSGHYYFRENFNADSSLIAGLILLEYISARGIPFSSIVDEFDRYAQSGEINFRINNVTSVISELKKKFSDAPNTDEVDGLSIWYSDWWCNIRPSKTEPLLRLNVEADNTDILQGKMRILEEKIVKLGGMKT